MADTEITLNSSQLRTLAHPLRSRLLSALRMDGPATATRLAEKLHTNTGATSYHLRQLAAVGMVVDEERPGAGRERWWRAAQRSHGWTERDIGDDPDDRAAADWLAGQQLRVVTEYVDTWLAERNSWPAAWRQAELGYDDMLRLTPERLQALSDELHEVVRRYREEPPEPGSERVIVAMFGFPRRSKE